MVIAADPSAADAGELARVLRRAFVPNKVLLFRPAGEQQPEIAELAPFTRLQKSIDGQATVYVCRDHACQLPVHSAEETLRLLESGRAASAR